MRLELRHGNTPNDKRARIEARAMAICQGAHWATEPDDSDINSDEAEEIEAAKVLAAKWGR